MMRGLAGGGGPYVDDYATIAAAWSAEKKLIAAYTGPLIRVRRSSDNAESDIGFDGTGLLDTAALAAFVGANSAYIKTVYRQSSGTSYSDLTQSSSTAQARIVNAGAVEADFAQLDGVNDFMEATIAGGLGVGTSIATVFLRANISSTNSNGQFGGAIDIGYNTSSLRGFAIYSESRVLTGTPGVVYGMSGSTPGPYMQRGFTDAARSPRNATHKHTARFNTAVTATDDTAIHAYLNGSDASQTTPASGDPSGTFNCTQIRIGNFLFASTACNKIGFRSLGLVAADALSAQADIEAIL